jgi:excisionase family DNA binding protein
VVPVSSVTVPRLLDVAEAAEFLGRSVNSMYIDCRAGRIPHYKVGHSLRFRLDDLEAWLESNRRGPKVGAS